MRTDASTGTDPLLSARNRVRIGSVPSWAAPCPFHVHFAVKTPSHYTHLLLGRQIHAETGEVFFHTVMRLETMQAVQHNSQWQLEFEPRTQLVTLHWIKIRRGDAERDFADMEKIRFLQREAGLERFMIQGWFTLLLLLEDVRPGDVIESCYTIQSRPELLGAYCTHIFTLPTGVSIGKFHFSARFNQSRPLKWRSSSRDLQPATKSENGETVWTWTGENYTVPAAEANAPPEYVSHPWMQVSDCADWGTVAKEAARAWKEEEASPALRKLLEEITRAETDPVGRATQAIQMIQDEFRYLNVDIGHGGHAPSSPEAVAQRRYGDCKDLSFLLTRVLKELGIPARPVLVNNQLRGSVAGMLPMAGLFNHAVVEFQLEGITCWVDAVLKWQGGDALNRFIPDYGLGLPVDCAAAALVKSPARKGNADVYELKETILLDSTGALSPMSAVVRATGHQADVVRNQMADLGKLEMAKARLQHYVQRFFKASRIGEMAVRDDRSNNEILLAEAFEIQGFTGATDKQERLVFSLENNIIVPLLAMPVAASWRAPFALPYPCHVLHVLNVQSSTMKSVKSDRNEIESRFFQFRQTVEEGWGRWTMKLHFSTLAAAVPANRVAEHMAKVAQVRKASSRFLLIPAGYKPPSKRKDFGVLPSPAMRGSNPPAIESQGTEDDANQAAPAPDANDAGQAAANAQERPGLSSKASPPANAPDSAAYFKERSGRRRKRSRRRQRRRRLIAKLTIVAILVIGLILYALVLKL